jgi:hypothetical protein
VPESGHIGHTGCSAIRIHLRRVNGAPGVVESVEPALSLH